MHAAASAAADPTAEPFPSSATNVAAHLAAVPASYPLGSPDNNPADDATDVPADDPADDPAGDPAGDPADDPADDPAAVKERWLAIADYAIQCLSPDAFNTPTRESDTTEIFKKGQALIHGFVEEQGTGRSWQLSLKAVLVTWASRHATFGLNATAKVLRQLQELSSWEPVRRAPALGSRIRPRDFHHMLKGLEKDGMLPILTFSL